jgi:hypothetical protein
MASVARSVAGLVLALSSAHPVPVAAQAPGSGLVEALAVLHGWDALRSRAWTAGDPEALRSLYVRGSAAGRADVRLLRAYDERGVVVRRIQTQVFAVRVLRRDAGTLVLRVFDRVAGGELVQDGHAAPLHSSRPVSRNIEFRRVAGEWRVVAVSDSVSGWGRGPRAVRR